MRRAVCLWSIVLLLTGGVGAADVPDLSAASAVMMDADSGRVLYGRMEDEPRLIASTTKLMTALVALESGHTLDERVTIRPEWTGIEGSSLYLKAGEELRLETLLYGMLLRSGNDAAHAVAGYCAGSVEEFVRRMNEKAKELGMENTCFSNPSGLNDANHFSTARDMAILAAACLNNEALRRIVGTRSITLEGKVLTNHNKLLWQYEGCLGLKTGYTRDAGRTLVSAAERDGMTLICVTLNAPDDWRDHAALFDYGFSNYSRNRLVGRGEVMCRIPVTGSLLPFCEVTAGGDLWAARKEGERVEVDLKLNSEFLSAPISEDTQIGQAVFSVQGEVLGSCSLYAGQRIGGDVVPGHTIWKRLFGGLRPQA